MKATKINKEEISDICVSALPNRPTSPLAMGGKGYSATEVKAAFDKLPLYIVDKYNDLIEDVFADGDDSICAAIPTGILSGQSLADLLSDIKGGEICSYFPAPVGSLGEYLLALRQDVDKIKAALNID
ncbi:MAG: hypothetical protein J6V09_03290 [Clostridia bacterium]|nr:hypothetical protein [Clostridia bacterium]